MSLGNVLILGDSYSTFQGYIPNEYEAYYSESEQSETDVRNVEETWWYSLIQETGSHLVLNESWSGSTIGYTGYGGVDCSDTSSFICRIGKLKESGFFENHRIDTVFVFGGTNDHWCEAPLGTMMYDKWCESDLYYVLPAICYFFKMLTDTLPEARIICLINSDLKVEIAEGLRNSCEKNDVPFVTLQNICKKCGHPTVEGMQQIKEQIKKGIGI